MTFAELRALHALIGTALDDIQRTYTASAAPHPLHPPDADPDGTSPPDFPSLSAPYDPSSPSEALLHDPAVARACARIVAAAGQLTAAVQNPFLTICDATMTYHLPACMRVLEASHVVEILREAGPDGLHVERIAARVPYPIDSRTLAHVLRLLATHHVLAERAPDVFANNRLSSYIDTGKSVAEILSNPDSKYADTDGVAAFVGLNTDELFKSSAYLADALLRLPEDRPPTRRPHRRGGQVLPTLRSFGSGTSRESLFGDPGEDLLLLRKPVSQDVTPEARVQTRVQEKEKEQEQEQVLQERKKEREREGQRDVLMSPGFGSGSHFGCEPPSAHHPFDIAEGKRDGSNRKRPPPPPSSSPLTAPPAEGAGSGSATILASSSSPWRVPASQTFSWARPLDLGAMQMKMTREGGRDEGGGGPGGGGDEGAGGSGKASGLGLGFRHPPSWAAKRARRGSTSNAPLVTASDSATETGTEAEEKTTPVPVVTTAFARAFGTDEPYFAWLESCAKAGGGEGGEGEEGEGEEGGEEGEERALTFCSRLHRFGAAMRGSARWEGESGILDGFDWASLEPGALVVDVGGGVGSHAMRLARAFPALRFVVQDRARVCEMGREVWKVQFPGAVEGGRVVFQGHDFFDEQPRVAREADVFLLRVITHDWPDADVRRILGRLREVAKPGARLVVGEHVLGEACHLGGRGADGAWDWPLLANGGRASACGHYMDMTMLSMFNAQERTAREMRALWASAGWCVGEVRRAAGNGGFGYIVAEPAVELHQGRL